MLEMYRLMVLIFAYVGTGVIVSSLATEDISITVTLLWPFLLLGGLIFSIVDSIRRWKEHGEDV